jgi:16S rRNA (guanine966-N2)-methyltransferase
MDKRAVGMRGGFKAKRLKIDGGLRPTLSKVRESLFNILMGRVEGSVFIDLFAGTGAVGMDAMARRSKAVYFVEADRERFERIRDLLSGCGCRPRANILNMRAEDFLKKAVKEHLKADIIFLDPPYMSGEIERLLPLLGEKEGILSAGAAVVAEHSKREEPPQGAGILKKKKSYKYGDTILTLYEVVND